MRPSKVKGPSYAHCMNLSVALRLPNIEGEKIRGELMATGSVCMEKHVHRRTCSSMGSHLTLETEKGIHKSKVGKQPQRD